MAAKNSSLVFLIVDDEPEIRELLVESLQDAGFKTHEAGDGYEAMLTIRREKVDIVVSDVRMEGGGGIELLANIKKERPEIVVYIVTGFTDIDPQEALKMGAAGFFAKPFRPAEVISTILASRK